MKKIIEIQVNLDDPELCRKLKRIMKPHLSVGRVSKCELCQTETSWTANNRPVCPKCQGEYGFVNKNWLPDPCEVCGNQGEWVCGENDKHSLCHRHRDSWFDYTKEVPLPRGWDKFPKDEKGAAWDKRFNDFVLEMKALIANKVD